MRYGTRGFTDGACKHKHKTIKEALRCIEKRREIEPVTDRTVWRYDDSGKLRLLRADETIEVQVQLKKLRAKS